ncbi:hypothetical protein [Rubritalea tangerina]|uniref:hypothetical protein n=1 Tax=Rubritalea tangerina TaxID=430798 RepID=UPI003613F986
MQGTIRTFFVTTITHPPAATKPQGISQEKLNNYLAKVPPLCYSKVVELAAFRTNHVPSH